MTGGKSDIEKDGMRMVGRHVGIRKESLNAIEFCLWGRCRDRGHRLLPWFVFVSC